MKKLILLSILSIIAMSCSSKVQRTKYSDKNMRVMVNPEGLEHANYMNLQTALVSTNTWTVLDRASGLKAVQTEQNMLHRYQNDRFEDREKFAHWGKLYGVGAVIVAYSDCRFSTSSWNNTVTVRRCSLYLNLVDANTGEVMVGVTDSVTIPRGSNPDWSESVEKLVEAYPKYFEENKNHKKLEEYKKESERRAISQNKGW